MPRSSVTWAANVDACLKLYWQDGTGARRDSLLQSVAITYLRQAVALAAADGICAKRSDF